MELRKENGNIYLKFGYNLDFSGKLKRYCGAKWQASTKEWYFSEEFEEKANDLMLKQFGFSMRNSPKMTIEYFANDFYNKEDLEVKIDGFWFVYRENSSVPVTLRQGTIILEGGFPEKGGSSRYPKAEPFEGTKLRSVISQELFDLFSDETKKQLSIISEVDKKEVLLARKAALLKELEEIEKELAEQ